MELKKKRNSNIEILRIISVFLIILNHYSLYGGFSFENSLGFNSLLVGFLHVGGKLGVNIFLFISGWYLCDSEKLNIKRPFYLITEVLFYCFIFIIIGLILGNLDIKDIIKLLLAIPFGRWEFITCYFMMICFSYWINKLIHNINIKQFKVLIIFLLFVWCIVPTFIKADFGMSTLTWYIFIYILAAYTKNVYTKYKFSSAKYFLIGIASYLLILISEVVLKLLGLKFEIFGEHYEHFRSLNSILVLSTTVFIFLGFVKLAPRENNFVQVIASTSLAVFIIHDNIVLREFIWNNIFHTANFSDSKFLIIHALITAITIFTFGTIVDLIRKKTFGVLEKKLFNNKLSECQNKLNDYLEKDKCEKD